MSIRLTCLLLLTAVVHAATGDRGLPRTLAYPPAAFHDAGGPIIDVTQAPYHTEAPLPPTELEATAQP